MKLEGEKILGEEGSNDLKYKKTREGGGKGQVAVTDL